MAASLSAMSSKILSVLGRFLELDVDVGDPGAGDGTDRFDLGVLGDGLFDPPGHPLLDPLGVHPGPRAEDQCDAGWNVGILALRHAEVADHAPQYGAYQGDPRDLALLGEIPGGVVGLLDDGRVVQVGHERSPMA